jgi:hypothetical protein
MRNVKKAGAIRLPHSPAYRKSAPPLYEFCWVACLLADEIHSRSGLGSAFETRLNNCVYLATSGNVVQRTLETI